MKYTCIHLVQIALLLIHIRVIIIFISYIIKFGLVWTCFIMSYNKISFKNREIMSKIMCLSAASNSQKSSYKDKREIVSYDAGDIFWKHHCKDHFMKKQFWSNMAICETNAGIYYYTWLTRCVIPVVKLHTSAMKVKEITQRVFCGV